jgi:Ala-tRNA(Pro) deacylase
MPILRKLVDFLDSHRIRYQVLTHSEAYTAQEVAALQHVPGKQMAKVVMVMSGGQPLMTVLPASRRLDLRRLRELVGGDVRLETESEFAHLFPGCETGAEPPFGNLFGVEVLVDQELADNDEIVMNAGTHYQTVRMSYADFARLVQPRVADFTHQAG